MMNFESINFPLFSQPFKNEIKTGANKFPALGENKALDANCELSPSKLTAAKDK